MPFSNGTLITDAGQVETLTVANTYVPVAGDIYLRGTLHDSSGNMYRTEDAVVGASDVFINGILHTVNGVRYSLNGNGIYKWPEGFATAADGRQAIRTIQINTNVGPRGIGRHVTSSRMNTVAGSGPVAPGNITLQANSGDFVQSFGTDLGNHGLQLTPGGEYNTSAEANTGTPFWTNVQFGVQWVDDGGASSDQFEAQLILLNGGSVNSPVFTGWSGYNEWLPITQNLQWVDINDIPATSNIAVIISIEVREIAVPANIVNTTYEGGVDNEP